MPPSYQEIRQKIAALGASYSEIESILRDMMQEQGLGGADWPAIFGDILYADTYWDDLTFPANSLNPPGAVADPDRDVTDGSLLFDASGIEVIFCQVQMPHRWKEGSIIKPHVHWAKTTSAAGDVVWGMQYKVYGIGEVAGAFSDIINTSTIAETLTDEDTAEQHLLTPLADIDMTGQTLSTMLLIRLARIGSDAADTYGADARLLEFDIHYEIDRPGSRELYIK